MIALLVTRALISASLMVPLSTQAQAHAQGSPPAPAPAPAPAPEPRPFGQLRLGSLSVTPGLRLVDLGIDTNVFNESGRQNHDFTTTLQPQLDVAATSRSFDLRLRGQAGLVYYQKYDSERAINPGVIASIERRFSSRLALVGAATYAYTKERFGYEIDSRPRQLTWGGHTGVRLASRRLAFELGGSRSETAFDTDARFLGTQLAEVLNRVTTGASASLAYRLSPYTSASLGADVRTDRFLLSPERDRDSARGYLGVRFAPRALIQGEVQAGVRTVRSRSALAPDFTGPTWRGGLTYTWPDRLSIGIGGQHDVEASFQPDRPYFLYDLIEMSIRQGLFTRFDIGVSASHVTMRHRAFLDAEPVASPRDRGYQVVRNLTVSTGLTLRRRSRIGVYATLWDRSAGDRLYESRRVGLQLTLGPVHVNERGLFLFGPGR